MGGGGGGTFARLGREAWRAKCEGKKKKKERFTVGPCMYDNTFYIFCTGSFHLSPSSVVRIASHFPSHSSLANEFCMIFFEF